MKKNVFRLVVFTLMFCRSISVDAQTEPTVSDYLSRAAADDRRMTKALDEGEKMLAEGRLPEANKFLLECISVERCKMRLAEIEYQQLPLDFQNFSQKPKNQDYEHQLIVWRIRLFLDELFPRFYQLSILKASLLADLGLLDEAREKLREAAQVKPDDPAVAALSRRLGLKDLNGLKSFDLRSMNILYDNAGDLERIFQSLRAMPSLKPRDEFENTVQFRQRLAAAEQTPYLEQLTLNSFLLIPVKNIMGADWSFEYDADQTEMRFRASFRHGNAEAVNNEASPLALRPVIGGAVPPGNYLIRIGNLDHLSGQLKDVSGPGVNFKYFEWQATARDSKPYLEAVAIVRLLNRQPGLPTCTGCAPFLDAKLHEIWIYDKRTGNVFYRLVDPATRLEEARQLFARGRYKEAAQLFVWVDLGKIKNLSLRSEISFFEARSLLAAGDKQAALVSLNVACLSQIVERAETGEKLDFAVFKMLVELSVELKNIDLAQRSINNFLNFEPDHQGAKQLKNLLAARKQSMNH